MLDIKTQVAILVAVTIGRLGHPPTEEQRRLLRKQARAYLFDHHWWPRSETMWQIDQFIEEATLQMNRWPPQTTEPREP